MGAQPSKHAGPKPAKLDDDLEEIVTEGQGEYIIDADRQVFDEIYQYLVEAAHPTADFKDRYAELTKKIEEALVGKPAVGDMPIGKMLTNKTPIFIPRTLYELVFVRLCIQEDLKAGSICRMLQDGRHRGLVRLQKDPSDYEAELRKEQEYKDKRGCWHECYFDDEGDNKSVQNLAYRVNVELVRLLEPAGCFTRKQLLLFTEREIAWFQEHSKQDYGEEIMIRTTHSPTTDFRFDHDNGCIVGMMITANKASIIRTAVQLECSHLAKSSRFLFRGSNFALDDVTKSVDNQVVPYSLSFGTGLFAGCIFDPTATAFKFMKKTPYAIAVPYDRDLIFFIPKTHTLAQMFGNGETFHARTKAWQGFPLDKMRGVNVGGYNRAREHLASDMSKEATLQAWEQLKSSSILLRDARNP